MPYADTTDSMLPDRPGGKTFGLWLCFTYGIGGQFPHVWYEGRQLVYENKWKGGIRDEEGNELHMHAADTSN